MKKILFILVVLLGMTINVFSQTCEETLNSIKSGEIIQDANGYISDTDKEILKNIFTALKDKTGIDFVLLAGDGLSSCDNSVNKEFVRNMGFNPGKDSVFMLIISSEGYRKVYRNTPCKNIITFEHNPLTKAHLNKKSINAGSMSSMTVGFFEAVAKEVGVTVNTSPESLLPPLCLEVTGKIGINGLKYMYDLAEVVDSDNEKKLEKILKDYADEMNIHILGLFVNELDYQKEVNDKLFFETLIDKTGMTNKPAIIVIIETSGNKKFLLSTNKFYNKLSVKGMDKDELGHKYLNSYVENGDYVGGFSSYAQAIMDEFGNPQKYDVKDTSATKTRLGITFFVIIGIIVALILIALFWLKPYLKKKKYKTELLFLEKKLQSLKDFILNNDIIYIRFLFDEIEKIFYDFHSEASYRIDNGSFPAAKDIISNIKITVGEAQTLINNRARYNEAHKNLMNLSNKELSRITGNTLFYRYQIEQGKDPVELWTAYEAAVNKAKGKKVVVPIDDDETVVKKLHQRAFKMAYMVMNIDKRGKNLIDRVKAIDPRIKKEDAKLIVDKFISIIDECQKILDGKTLKVKKSKPGRFKEKMIRYYGNSWHNSYKSGGGFDLIDFLILDAILDQNDNFQEFAGSEYQELYDDEETIFDESLINEYEQNVEQPDDDNDAESFVTEQFDNTDDNEAGFSETIGENDDSDEYDQS